MSNMILSNTAYDEERALYGLTDAELHNVRFAGPADGESALKECRNIRVNDTTFDLRYPLWHTNGVKLQNSLFSDTCRAALWYTSNVSIAQSKLLGIKALRECDEVTIDDSEIVSEEFGWSSSNVVLRNSSLTSEYAFFHGRNLRLEDCDFAGKYSFQYVDGLVIEGGTLNTKDAFWHSHNVVVRNATLKGEYLGWYSDGLTLINCRIEGTQPFVRCTNLTVIDCEMVGCDLAFEGSDVQAIVRGHVDSIRDPRSGRIYADSVGEIVHDTVLGCGADIRIGSEPPCLCVHSGTMEQPARRCKVLAATA